MKQQKHTTCPTSCVDYKLLMLACIPCRSISYCKHQTVEQRLPLESWSHKVLYKLQLKSASGKLITKHDADGVCCLSHNGPCMPRRCQAAIK